MFVKIVMTALWSSKIDYCDWVKSASDPYFLSFLSRFQPWETRRRFWSRNCPTLRKQRSSFSLTSPAETEPSSSSKWWGHLFLHQTLLTVWEQDHHAADNNILCNVHVMMITSKCETVVLFVGSVSCCWYLLPASVGAVISCKVWPDAAALPAGL